MYNTYTVHVYCCPLTKGNADAMPHCNVVDGNEPPAGGVSPAFKLDLWKPSEVQYMQQQQKVYALCLGGNLSAMPVRCGADDR